MIKKGNLVRIGIVLLLITLFFIPSSIGEKTEHNVDLSIRGGFSIHFYIVNYEDTTVSGEVTIKTRGVNESYNICIQPNNI